jgi:hypothetical protein
MFVGVITQPLSRLGFPWNCDLLLSLSQTLSKFFEQIKYVYLQLMIWIYSFFIRFFVLVAKLDIVVIVDE